MFILIVIFICFLIFVFFFFKVINKQPPQLFWKVSLPDIIQILIFSALIITAYFTYNSINEQKNYNKNALRPWLQVMIDSTTSNPLYYDKNGFLRINYTMTNKGQTPAFNVKSYLCPDFSSIYPESAMLEQINGDTNSKKISIFQGCSYNMLSSQLGLMGEVAYEAILKNGKSETLWVKIPDIRNISNLFDILDKSDNKLHVHVYTEYFDVNNNLYANRSSFYLRQDKTDSIYGLEVFLVACSQEKIKHYSK